MKNIDWNEIHQMLSDLYKITERFESIFPGRKFTLDGHLVGSIGEVIAAYMFDLELEKNSTKGHDAKSKDGKTRVEIKFTQGLSVGIRDNPEHLLVLQRLKGRKIEVIYNGPGELAWENAGKRQKNGQRQISIKKLNDLNHQLAPKSRLEQKKTPPI